MLRLTAGVEHRRDRVPLARRAGVDRIEAVERVGHRVGLDELVARVMGLRPDVDARDVESGPLVAAGSTTGTREQVKKSRRHPRDRSSSARLNASTRGQP
jgi:hypothetical protein